MNEHNAEVAHYCPLCKRYWAWRLSNRGRWIKWVLLYGHYQAPHFKVCKVKQFG